MTADKNMIDKDEYPQTAEIEQPLREHHRPTSGTCPATGTRPAARRPARARRRCSAGLALKWRWRERMRAAGKPTDRPNLVTGANVQVCWEKFCRYWDVEPRLVPMEGDRFHLDAEQAVALCDENTIGVVDGARLDLRRQLRAGRARSPPRSTSSPTAAGPTCRSTSTRPRAASSRPSSNPSSCGTSASRACIDQRLGPQVRARLPGRRLGDLARRRRPARRI